MKIQNRFKPGKFITVHDQLWMDLTKLNLGYPSGSVSERIINGERYLINSFQERNGYEIGLAVKEPKPLVAVTVDIERLFENLDDNYAKYYDYMKERLCFSSEEVLMADILFSKYLNNSYATNLMSYKEIEMYRNKSSSNHNIVINEQTSKKYWMLIKSLSNKMIYLKTTDTFRKPRYGANNKELFQPFLTLLNSYNVSKNNDEFEYSFGNYGKLIRQSRRYSNILPDSCYQYAFKQANKHRVAVYLAQSIFWAKYHPKYGNTTPSVNEICESVYGNYNYNSKQFRKVKNYMEDILGILKDRHEISYYGIQTTRCYTRGCYTRDREKYNKFETCVYGYSLIIPYKVETENT